MIRHLRLVIAIALSAAVASACAVVNRDHLDQLESSDAGDGMDATVTPPDTGVDAGPDDLLRVIDRCGDTEADYVILDDSTAGQVLIDTTSMTNRVSMCGDRASPGHDGFIAIDVQAGDQWHFHVVPDPSVADNDRDPFVYLLFAPAGSCDARDCEHNADRCDTGGEEHFAFVAPSQGRWYLGIDDRNAGGGRYLLEAVRLQCGDGVKVHGESCDGEADCDPSSCRTIRSETSPLEREPNDNEIEANLLQFPTSGELTIEGSIGGTTEGNAFCTVPDMYFFRVQNPATTLAVRMIKDDETPCDSGSLTPFDIVLRGSDGAVRATSTTNAAGCRELTVTDLDAASYLISLEHDVPIEGPAIPYNMHLALTL